MAIVVNKGLAIPADNHIPSPRNVGAPDLVLSVTPSDTTDLSYTTRAIWCETAGTVAVQNNGVTQTYTLLPNDWYAIKAQRILATGTTATGIKVGR